MSRCSISSCCTSSSPRTVSLLLAILVVGEIKSNHVLGAAGPPKRRLVGHQEQVVVKSGGTLRLTCPVEGDSTLLIEWRKDGHVIHTGRDDRYRLTPSSLTLTSRPINEASNGNNTSVNGLNGATRIIDTLRIRDMTSADAGLFVCLATNGFGTVDVSFHVYVRQTDSNDTGSPPADDHDHDDQLHASNGHPPKFIDLEHMTSRKKFAFGTTERLTCASSGEPRPHVTWYKNGSKMQTTDADYSSWTAVEEQDQLVLDDIRLSDSGQYQCLVSNSFGNISFTYHVTVDDHATLQPEFERSHPHDTNVSYGHTASFLCYVRSPTEPHIQWLKRTDTPSDGVIGRDLVRITLDNPNYVVVGTAPADDNQRPQYESATVKQRDGIYLSKLRIRRVTNTDAGRYVCFTTNHAGYTYREADLTVWKAETVMSDSVSSSMLDGSSARKSSNDVLVHWFFPFVVVAVVLTSVVLVAAVGLAVFRRRGQLHRDESCSFVTPHHRVSHPSSQILGLPSSSSPNIGFVAVTSSSNDSIPDVLGVQGGHFNGLECGAGIDVRHHVSLDRSLCLRRESSGCEVSPMQRPQQSPTDIDVITGKRNATLSRLRSRHDQHVVVERPRGSGLEYSSMDVSHVVSHVTTKVRRASNAHNSTSGETDPPLLKSMTVGGKLTGGFDKNNTGVGSKSSTLIRGSRMRPSMVTRDGGGRGNGGAGGGV